MPGPYCCTAACQSAGCSPSARTAWCPGGLQPDPTYVLCSACASCCCHRAAASEATTTQCRWRAAARTGGPGWCATGPTGVLGKLSECVQCTGRESGRAACCWVGSTLIQAPKPLTAVQCGGQRRQRWRQPAEQHAGAHRVRGIQAGARRAGGAVRSVHAADAEHGAGVRPSARKALGQMFTMRCCV